MPLVSAGYILHVSAVHAISVDLAFKAPLFFNYTSRPQRVSTHHFSHDSMPQQVAANERLCVIPPTHHCICESSSFMFVHANESLRVIALTHQQKIMQSEVYLAMVGLLTRLSGRGGKSPNLTCQQAHISRPTGSLVLPVSRSPYPC